MGHFEKLESYLKMKEEQSAKLKMMRMMGVPVDIKSPPKISYVNSQVVSEDEYSDEEEEEEEDSEKTQ
jgi:hypothetical protein